MSQQDLTQRKGNQVIHVRDNSSDELEELFNVAMNPSRSGQSGQVPMKMRNFPPSFFTPPSSQQQRQLVPGHTKQGSNDSTGYAPGTLPVHTRAHSSPANLQQTLSTVPQNLPQHQHARQHSCDALLDNEPLPPGWEKARTPDGQLYYLNHILQTTTWIDPRKTMSPSLQLQLQQQNPQQNTQPPTQHSPNVSLNNLGPLPPGWEQAYTQEGEMYFINHMERTTSWMDPRLILSTAQRMQDQLRIQPPQVSAHSQITPKFSHSPTLQMTQLQAEKEILRKRQEEIDRQEMLLRARMQQLQQSGDNALKQDQLQSVTDPFLGQNPSSDHSRQASTDSGVGGMGTGTSYSLPRTPEDFLSNVDEMDTHDTGHRFTDFGGMDIGSLTTDDTSNMDSDNLVPSLQEDLSGELQLNEMDVLNKDDNGLLTWL